MIDSIKLYKSNPDTIKHRLYLHGAIFTLFLICMISISVWSGNTLTMITAIARFERTHTVSRLEAKNALLEYVANRDTQSQEAFYGKMAITQSYNKVFSSLLAMRTTKSDKEFTQILESTFTEADHATATIIVNRIKVLYWHPIIKDLVGYAGGANQAGEKIVALMPGVLAATTMDQQSSVLQEIKDAEADFIFNERSFSKHCSDLANEISNFVGFVSIAILVLSFGFICLTTYLIASSLLQQAARHASELEKSKKQYLDLVEGTPDLITRVDIEGHLVFVNHAALEILGLKPVECIGRIAFDFIHPDDRESTMAAFQTWREHSGEIFTHENRLIGINGREHYMSWSIHAEIDENGNITGLASTARDISERKQGEKEKEKLKSLLRALIDSCPAWVACLDTEGNYLIANKYYTETFLLPLSQIEGHSPKEFFPPDLYERHKQLMDQSLALGKTLQWEDQTSLKENQITHVYGSYTPLYDTNGSLFGVSAFGLDISALRQAEKEKDRLQAQIQQAVKMQAVGTLAGGIAHEFNNLLAVILGCTELASEEVPRESFAKTQLDNVITASYRVRDLVKQILTFSRQGQQKRSVANLCPLVKESLKLIASSIPTSVTIQSHIDSGCRNVSVDPTEIQQIVMNLCSNAVWSMKEKGTIAISVNEVSLTDNDELIPKGLPAGDYVKLSFSDTGCGMDHQTVSQIFVPFFTTKAVGQGTGMGLSIIYGIMESYGGTITVESEVGKGTTFHLYFPVTEEPTGEDQKQVELVPKGNERILLVDDEKIYADMEAEMIGRLGYAVNMKTDSIEALGVFRAAPEDFDLVVTDQIMPGLSGEELVKEIRAIRPEMPIILCTGYSTQMDEEKARSLGINGFAFKPMARKDIANLIRKVLDALS